MQYSHDMKSTRLLLVLHLNRLYYIRYAIIWLNEDFSAFLLIFTIHIEIT